MVAGRSFLGLAMKGTSCDGKKNTFEPSATTLPQMFTRPVSGIRTNLNMISFARTDREDFMIRDLLLRTLLANRTIYKLTMNDIAGADLAVIVSLLKSCMKGGVTKSTTGPSRKQSSRTRLFRTLDFLRDKSYSSLLSSFVSSLAEKLRRMLALDMRSSSFSGAKPPFFIKPSSLASSFSAYCWLLPSFSKTLT